jgi:hypothetical protein
VTTGGPDAVYGLSLDQAYNVSVSVSAATSADGGAPSTARPFVYLRTSPCPTGRELACDDENQSTASLHVKSMAPGLYYIFLDSFDAHSGGLVNFMVALSPPTTPANETCETANAITTDGTPVRVDLGQAEDNEPTTCNALGIDTRDVVFTFDLLDGGDVVAEAVRVDGGSAALELRGADCATSSVLSCANNPNGTSILRAPSLDPGTYFLVVDANNGQKVGAIDVSVTAVGQPPPYDTCAGAWPITLPLDGGIVVEDVDTSFAHDDYVGTCNMPPDADAGFVVPDSPEFVFKLRLNSAATLHVTAGPSPGSDVDSVIYLRSGNCTESDGLNEEFCVNNRPHGVTETFTKALPAGDHYLFIESWQGFVGPTHVTMSATP